MRSQFRTVHSIQNALIAISFLSLIACHSGQFPNAPDLSADPPEAHSSPSTLRIALTPFTLRKSAGEQTSSKVKTKRIGIKGGQISIVHEKTKARFIVPRDALDEKTKISMQLHGSGTSTVVEFGPDGLHFDKPALLALTFSAEGVDPEILGGYLLGEDGSGTPIRHRVIVKNNRITVLMHIAHFSEYFIDDNEEVEEDLSIVYDEDTP
ncbi:MAG: hypothetical protein HOH77_14385 [Candidatus Latescibacteria bacterium]|nr:hypothetical protein [Candidatus Latescibacterota bacterium]